MEALIAALLTGIGPSSDSERARRRKRRALVISCGAVVALVAFRMLTTQGLADPTDLRASMIAGWLMLLIAGSLTFVLRKQLLQHSVSRRGTYFFVVLMAFIALCRTIRPLVGIPDPGFHLLEELGLAMMVALEIPIVGKQYIWPMGCLLASNVILVALPAYSAFLCNACLGLAALLAVFLRPWSAPSSDFTTSHGS
jgi:hypothetical protein